MEITVTKKIKYRIEKLSVSMGVIFWGYAKVNGKECANENDMPLSDKGRWNITIDLESGIIDDWPFGITASTYFKVYDDGVYKLLDKHGYICFEGKSYVPSILSRKGEVYGDYVYLDIDENGKIKNWVCNDALLQEIVNNSFRDCF